MPKTKNCWIRYRILDRCFRNGRRKYFIEDLLYEVNSELEDYDGSQVSERQIRQDIHFLQREAGGSIPLVTKHDGHRVYYTYTDKSFSIMNLPLTQSEAETLNDTIQMLSRFKGIPKYSWMNEMLARLKVDFELDDGVAGTVSFAHNPDLHGLKWFEPLLEAIVKKECVELSYHRFGHADHPRIVFPLHLRQWDDRWYLLGIEERLKPRIPFTVIPIDRIDDVNISAKSVNESQLTNVNFGDYFKDVIGVSRLPEGKSEKVLLKVGYPDAEYIETKPLHHSQITVERAEKYMIFELDVILNYELETEILTYAHNCEIINPAELRKNIKKRTQKILEKISGF